MIFWRFLIRRPRTTPGISQPIKPVMMQKIQTVDGPPKYSGRVAKTIGQAICAIV